MNARNYNMKSELQSAQELLTIANIGDVIYFQRRFYHHVAVFLGLDQHGTPMVAHVSTENAADDFSMDLLFSQLMPPTFICDLALRFAKGMLLGTKFELVHTVVNAVSPPKLEDLMVTLYTLVREPRRFAQTLAEFAVQTLSAAVAELLADQSQQQYTGSPAVVLELVIRQLINFCGKQFRDWLARRREFAPAAREDRREVKPRVANLFEVAGADLCMIDNSFDSVAAPFDPFMVVARAKQMLQMEGGPDYEMKTANCEHFAIKVRNGISFSTQVNTVMRVGGTVVGGGIGGGLCGWRFGLKLATAKGLIQLGGMAKGALLGASIAAGAAAGAAMGYISVCGWQQWMLNNKMEAETQRRLEEQRNGRLIGDDDNPIGTWADREQQRMEETVAMLVRLLMAMAIPL